MDHYADLVPYRDYDALYGSKSAPDISLKTSVSRRNKSSDDAWFFRFTRILTNWNCDFDAAARVGLPGVGATAWADECADFDGDGGMNLSEEEGVREEDIKVYTAGRVQAGTPNSSMNRALSGNTLVQDQDTPRTEVKQVSLLLPGERQLDILPALNRPHAITPALSRRLEKKVEVKEQLLQTMPTINRQLLETVPAINRQLERMVALKLQLLGSMPPVNRQLSELALNILQNTMGQGPRARRTSRMTARIQTSHVISKRFYHHLPSIHERPDRSPGIFLIKSSTNPAQLTQTAASCPPRTSRFPPRHRNPRLLPEELQHKIRQALALSHLLLHLPPHPAPHSPEPSQTNRARTSSPKPEVLSLGARN